MSPESCLSLDPSFSMGVLHSALSLDTVPRDGVFYSPMNHASGGTWVAKRKCKKKSPTLSWPRGNDACGAPDGAISPPAYQRTKRWAPGSYSTIAEVPDHLCIFPSTIRNKFEKVGLVLAAKNLVETAAIRLACNSVCRTRNYTKTPGGYLPYTA